MFMCASWLQVALPNAIKNTVGGGGGGAGQLKQENHNITNSKGPSK